MFQAVFPEWIYSFIQEILTECQLWARDSARFQRQTVLFVMLMVKEAVAGGSNFQQIIMIFIHLPKTFSSFLSNLYEYFASYLNSLLYLLQIFSKGCTHFFLQLYYYHNTEILKVYFIKYYQNFLLLQYLEEHNLYKNPIQPYLIFHHVFEN